MNTRIRKKKLVCGAQMGMGREGGESEGEKRGCRVGGGELKAVLRFRIRMTKIGGSGSESISQRHPPIFIIDLQAANQKIIFEKN